MRAVSDHADKIVTNGSATVLRMSIREKNSVLLGVFDPSNGDDVNRRTTSGKWYEDANRRRASDRRTLRVHRWPG